MVALICVIYVRQIQIRLTKGYSSNLILNMIY
jgi:hypothetical protein